MTTQNRDAHPQLRGEWMSVTENGDSGRVALLSDQQSTHLRPVRQAEPLHLRRLRQVAELAKAEGDREGYLLARRAFLLAQAEAWEVTHAVT